MTWGVTAAAAARHPHTPAHGRARGRALIHTENPDPTGRTLTAPGTGTSRSRSGDAAPSPSPPSPAPCEPPAQRRARPGVMTGQPGPAAPSDPLPPRRRVMDAPRAGSLRPSRFAAGSCQKKRMKIRIRPRFPAGREERGCCRAPGQAGDAYRCILIVRPAAANHGPTATEAPGVRPCPSRGAAGAHAELVRARSHAAAPRPLWPNKREQSEAVRCQRGGRGRHRRRAPGAEHRGAGANWAAATGGFYFGSRPGGFSSDKHARGVADSPAGAERRAEPPRGCRGAGSGRGGPVANSEGHSPTSRPGAPRSRFPPPRAEHPRAAAGTGGSVPAPAPAPFPASRRQRPSRPGPAARRTGRSRTGSWRLPTAMLGAQSERPAAQIPPARSAPANLNNSERRREHVQSAALPLLLKY